MVGRCILFLILNIAPLAGAEVSFRVCEADGETAFHYRDVMVGDKLTIIVSSDSNGFWGGGLYVVGVNRRYGTQSRSENSEWAGGLNLDSC